MVMLYNFSIQGLDVAKNVTERVDKMLNNVKNVKVKVVLYKCSKLVQALINKCKRYVKIVQVKANF